MAEEDKKANILVVSLTQTSRIIFIGYISSVDFIFFQDSHNTTGEHVSKAPALTQALDFWQIIIIFLAVAIVYFLMAKINFPTKQLLALYLS